MKNSINEAPNPAACKQICSNDNYKKYIAGPSLTNWSNYEEMPG